MKKENLRNIKSRFQDKTGVDLVAAAKLEKTSGIGISRKMERLAVALCASIAAFCLVAFTYSKVSSIDGDEVGFYAAYAGSGIFQVSVHNGSGKTLRLQDNVMLKRWSTGEDVIGNAKAVEISDLRIAAHSTETITINLSDAYDIDMLEEPLPAGDWYYLVLTNNNFMFGQDWQCTVDFKEKTEEEILAGRAAWENLIIDGMASGDASGDTLGNESGVANDDVQAIDVNIEADTNDSEIVADGSDDLEIVAEGNFVLNKDIADDSWVWPTVSHVVATPFGIRQYALDPSIEVFHSWINIAGSKGDPVYAVADAIVTEAGFDETFGYYIYLEIVADASGDEPGRTIQVQYGHLDSVKVALGDRVTAGETIGRLGASGRATGPNLSFAVYVNGEAVDPLE